MSDVDGTDAPPNEVWRYVIDAAEEDVKKGKINEEMYRNVCNVAARQYNNTNTNINTNITQTSSDENHRNVVEALADLHNRHSSLLNNHLGLHSRLSRERRAHMETLRNQKEALIKSNEALRKYKTAVRDHCKTIRDYNKTLRKFKGAKIMRLRATLS